MQNQSVGLMTVCCIAGVGASLLRPLLHSGEAARNACRAALWGADNDGRNTPLEVAGAQRDAVGVPDVFGP